MNIKNIKMLVVSALAICFSGHVSAYTLTEDPDCTLAVSITPAFSACSGAYLLGPGENDVTDGEADNIVNQLLNVNDVFGTDGGWNFLGKTDDSSTSTEFDLTGLNNTNGTLTVTGLTLPKKVVVSFKSAKNFSLYLWDPLNNPGTINWVTDGTATNGQGNAQGLSHASVYWMDTDITITETPEPVSLLLFGTGLMSLAFIRRRRLV